MHTVGGILVVEARTATRGFAKLFAQRGASFTPDVDPRETGIRLKLRFILQDSYLQKLHLAVSRSCRAA